MITVMLAASLMFISACGENSPNDNKDDSGNSTTTRSFYMGFTPWPYAATTEAVNNVYNFINTEGDIIAHHFQQGIPYTAANTLDYTTYHENIRNEIEGRISATQSGKTIYLAIDSLNAARNDLPDLWESSSNMPRHAPWDTRTFSSAEFITAYTEFSLAMIYKFKNSYGSLPVYFNYGTEISELMLNDPAKYNEYVTFAKTVYTTLKNSYPDIKLMVSIALKSPGSTEMASVKEGFARIAEYTDVVGISTYGYAFYSHADRGNPANLPEEWLSQISQIAPGKPCGITETGWIAEDLSVPAYSLSVHSSPEYQTEYLKKLFTGAEELSAEMIIWFTAYDYDILWTDTLGQDSLSMLWKDTGLADPVSGEREALSVWRERLNYTRTSGTE